MKSTLFTCLGLTLLAFASNGQIRQSGVPEHSILEGNQTQTFSQSSQSTHLLNEPPITTPLVKAPCIDTLLYEDFQSQTIQGSWINQDLDGATDANGRPLDWYVMFDVQTTTPGDTNYVGASSSWFSPLGTANNVLIMDAVSPCANTIMKWSSAPFEGPTYMDGYEVRLSTTGTNIADFTTTLFTAAESVNGTATPSAGTVHTLYNGTNGVLSNWSVNLGAYDNQTVYIAFFHNSNDDNLIMIDDIFIGTVTPFDLEIVSTETEPYYSTPLLQVASRTFASKITLAQDQSVTTPTVNFEIFQGATSVFTDAQSVATLIPLDTITLTSTAYTAPSVETYTTVVTASAVETDPFPLNNIDSLTFVISDSIYATEDGTFNGSLGIGAGTAGFLGNHYPVLVTDQLTSVSFTLSTPVIGDTIVGAVYDMIGGNPNQIIAMTDTLFVTVDTPAEYTLSIVGGAAILTPGDYVVGIQEGLFANASLATNTEYYTPGSAWVFFNAAWGNNEDFGFPNTYLMHANFGVCNEPISAYTNAAIDTVVDFTDATNNNPDSWSWDFGDGNTSTQQNPTHTYSSDGTYTVCLISSNPCGSDTVCMPIIVTTCVDPVASFTDIVNVGSVDFTNTSTSLTNTVYAWDFDDGQTSTLENPTNVYTTNGTYSVCLTITDSCGVDTICNNVMVSTIGIDENSFINQLSIFPIPAQNQITIANLTSGENFKLELLNSLGQVVQVNQSEGLITVQLNLSNIADGYYQLRVSSSVMTGTRPMIIKH